MLLEGLVTYDYCFFATPDGNEVTMVLTKMKGDSAIYNGPVLDGFLQNMIRQRLVTSH